MNKSELIDAAAVSANCSKPATSRVLDALLSTLQDELSKGNEVHIPGFGTWVTRNREERTGRNPQTGKTIQIRARKVPSFTADEALRAAVNKK